jgi:TIR domain
MRVFLSYHTPDGARAEALKRAIEAKAPGTEVFFAPSSLKAGGFWMPQLGESIAAADAFLLLVGDRLGPFQTIEYYQAFERHAMKPHFPLVPVLTAEKAPGLPFISQIHWIASPSPEAEPDLTRIIAAAAARPAA